MIGNIGQFSYGSHEYTLLNVDMWICYNLLICLFLFHLKSNKNASQILGKLGGESPVIILTLLQKINLSLKPAI